MTEQKKPLAEKVAEILKANRNAIYIGRVPPKYKRKFIEWAEEEFCGDYGMLLVHLMDVTGATDRRYEELNKKLNALLNWIAELESRIDALSSRPEKPLKTVSGRVLNKKVE